MTGEFIYRFFPGRADAPTLLLLHGTGGNEDDLIPIGRELSPDAALLSPRGKVLERGMPRFFRRLAEGVFDHEDLVARTHELADFVQAAPERDGFAPRGVVAVGFSNGANIAASLLLLHPRLLRGAILFRPMVPFIPPSPPDLSGIPVFIGAGQADPLVPAAETERLATLLRTAGATVTLNWAPAGHQLTAAELAAAKAWVARCLASPPPGPYTTDAS